MAERVNLTGSRAVNCTTEVTRSTDYSNGDGPARDETQTGSGFTKHVQMVAGHPLEFPTAG